jgi:Domain of unknown function (DUF4145)
MNTLTFIAEIIKALAWPVLIVFLVLLLRKPIRELVPLFTRFKYKDIELEFKQGMAVARAEIQEELPSRKNALASGAKMAGALVRLAEASPSAAIMKAWEKVEIAARLTAHRGGLFSPADVTNTTRVIRALEEGRVIDPRKVDLLHDLRGLRNLAAHSPDFALSTSDALDYIQWAQSMVDYLETAHRPDPEA